MENKAIDNFCRLCAIESQSGIIIYSAEGENLCLEEKIMNCLRIEISRDDLLPKKVCQLCSELLDDYHRFCERAVQVQQTLCILLGMHPPYTPSDDVQLCLMQTDVKIESNAIKNEMDELGIHSGSSQIDNEKFDLLPGLDVGHEYRNGIGKRNSNMVEYGNKESFADENYFNYHSKSKDAIDSLIDNVRQMHRRKMTLPKKASLSEGLVIDKLFHERLHEEQKKNCFDSCSNVNVTDFKYENFNNTNLLKDIENNEDKNHVKVISERKDKNNLEFEKEWTKQWGIMCNKCANIFSTRSLFDKHYRLYYNEKPVYTCSYCKVSIEKYSDYQTHILDHIHEGQFKCEFCDKKFCTEGFLQIHVDSHNQSKESYICEECGLEFSTQKRLNTHKKKHIKQNQEYRCHECGKVLQTKGGLTAHLSVHKLGRRFMCHLCGKTFTQKINMQQHVKHHKGEKPFSCEDCGKSFTEKSHLNRHKSFHTLERPYQCSVCKKMYKTERCLKVHSHVHLNTRPYVCTYCGKGFLSSTKLKQHYNCHTGERPFVCKYCERTFTNYPNWLKHIRRRHKVDHKTGLSLKEESKVQNAPSVIGDFNPMTTENGEIEFIEMPEVEVKDDREDGIQPLNGDNYASLLQTAMMTQYEDSVNELTEFQHNSLPGLVNSNNYHPVHLTPYFKMGFKDM